MICLSVVYQLISYGVDTKLGPLDYNDLPALESSLLLIKLMILTGKSRVLPLFNSVQGMAGWLLLIFFIWLHNQLSSIHSIIAYYEHRYLKNAIHQIDGKNEWLHLSAKFTANFLARFTVSVLKSNSHLSKKNVFFVSLKALWKCWKMLFFILKALFVLKIFKLLSWHFGQIEKMAWLER